MLETKGMFLMWEEIIFDLVAAIHFNIRTVYIKFIGTHAEYDKIDPAKARYKK
jgi:mRNA interferase HigB